jgi:aminoglycoside phosphotransferase (APT) family kinase protein
MADDLETNRRWRRDNRVEDRTDENIRSAIVGGLTPVRRVIDEIHQWLDAQPFEARRPTILHRDLKLNNVIIDPSTLTARAVVDWDMGTRGDPLFDLATLLSYWSEPADPECLRTLNQMPTTLPGFWSRDVAARRYAALTG